MKRAAVHLGHVLSTWGAVRMGAGLSDWDVVHLERRLSESEAENIAGSLEKKIAGNCSEDFSVVMPESELYIKEKRKANCRNGSAADFVFIRSYTLVCVRICDCRI